MSVCAEVRLVDLVRESALRMTPQQAADAVRTDWQSLLTEVPAPT